MMCISVFPTRLSNINEDNRLNDVLRIIRGGEVLFMVATHHLPPPPPPSLIL